MKDHAMCALTKQIMKEPVLRNGNYYEKEQIINFLRENQGIQDEIDMDLKPAEEAVKVICKIARDYERKDYSKTQFESSGVFEQKSLMMPRKKEIII